MHCFLRSHRIYCTEEYLILRSILYNFSQICCERKTEQFYNTAVYLQVFSHWLKECSQYCYWLHFMMLYCNYTVCACFILFFCSFTPTWYNCTVYTEQLQKKLFDSRIIYNMTQYTTHHVRNEWIVRIFRRERIEKIVWIFRIVAFVYTILYYSIIFYNIQHNSILFYNIL